MLSLVIVRYAYLILIALVSLTGCASAAKPIAGPRVTIFVPGVLSDHPAYAGLLKTLEKEHGPVEVFKWGSAVMSLNFSDAETHAKAEGELPNRLVMLPESVTEIDIIAHSAGCGVTLGALRRTNRNVNTVVLLAPSVSPEYDLTRPLTRAARIHAFISDHDTAFLKWRTGNFGTYDRIKTAAAGNVGFNTDQVREDLRGKLIEHPYQPDWSKIGNDGGHMGATDETFFKSIVLPFLQAEKQ